MYLSYFFYWRCMKKKVWAKLGPKCCPCVQILIKCYLHPDILVQSFQKHLIQEKSCSMYQILECFKNHNTWTGLLINRRSRLVEPVSFESNGSFWHDDGLISQDALIKLNEFEKDAIYTVGQNNFWGSILTFCTCLSTTLMLRGL